MALFRDLYSTIFCYGCLADVFASKFESGLKWRIDVFRQCVS